MWVCCWHITLAFIFGKSYFAFISQCSSIGWPPYPIPWYANLHHFQRSLLLFLSLFLFVFLAANIFNFPPTFTNLTDLCVCLSVCIDPLESVDWQFWWNLRKKFSSLNLFQYPYLFIFFPSFSSLSGTPVYMC